MYDWMQSLKALIFSPFVQFLTATVIAIFLYFRAKKVKRFSYEVQSFQVVSEDHLSGFGKLSVLYEGQPVPRLTQTLVRFWNSGQETIRKSDIAPADPLRWVIQDDAEILAYQVEKVSRDVISVGLAEPSSGGAIKTITISIDFLDHRDGAIISLLHTGTENAAELRGTFLGIPKGLKYVGGANLASALGEEPPKSSLRAISQAAGHMLLYVATSALGLFMFLGFVAPDVAIKLFPSSGQPDTTAMLVPGEWNWLYFFGALFFLGFSVLMTLVWLQRPPKKLK